VNAECIEGKLGHGILGRINDFCFYSTENKCGICINQRERDDKQKILTQHFTIPIFPPVSKIILIITIIIITIIT
jgi:hypothetical protein